MNKNTTTKVTNAAAMPTPEELLQAALAEGLDSDSAKVSAVKAEIEAATIVYGNSLLKTKWNNLKNTTYTDAKDMYSKVLDFLTELSTWARANGGQKYQEFLVWFNLRKEDLIESLKYIFVVVKIWIIQVGTTAWNLFKKLVSYFWHVMKAVAAKFNEGVKVFRAKAVAALEAEKTAAAIKA